MYIQNLECSNSSKFNNIAIKQYFQPSMLYSLIIWDNQTQTIMETDQEVSIYAERDTKKAKTRSCSYIDGSNSVGRRDGSLVVPQ